MSETPSKGDAESTSPYHTRKDKNCPYCKQAFTSSSLGRHLDLWIKEKNPKAPDGVHDVEEIRKIRGTVTRRRVKSTTGSRRYSSTSAASPAATPVAGSKRSPAASEDVNSAASPVTRKDSAAAIPGFNVHNFAVTGVINDIDRDAASTPNSARRLASHQIQVSHLNMDMVRKVQDAEDRARAAELALREFVSSWRAAKLHIDMSSMPFDFDPLSLDFPALTLQCLQPPPTLCAVNPFSTESTWSIQPPGEQQCTALRAYFSEQFRRWRIKCAVATTALQEDIQYPPSEFAFKEDPQEAVRRAEKLADLQEKKVSDHIHTAYSSWEAMPQQRKQDTWLLELARSVARKQKQIKSMEDEQHRVRQENANLRIQIDQLNKLQQPREFKIMPPVTLPVSEDFIDFCQEQAVIHGRRTLGMNMEDRRSDVGTVVDVAIDRWKHVIVSSRTAASGVGGKRTVDQAGLNAEDAAGNAVSSALGSEAAAPQNKSRALSAADDRPKPRFERIDRSGGPGQAAVYKTASAASGQRNGEVPPKIPPQYFTPHGPSSGSSHQSEAPEVPGSRTGTTTSSAPTSVVERIDTDRQDDMSDEDSDAERADEFSDRDANAEKDDGMSDQDADAEMEDDDTLGYSDMSQVPPRQAKAGTPTPPQVEQSQQRHQLPAASSQPSAQVQFTVPRTRPSTLAFSSNINPSVGGTSVQPEISTIRFMMPDGSVRTPVPPFLHSN